MAYCLIADLYSGLNEDEVVKLTDDRGAGTVGLAAAEAAIEKGAQIIDSYIGLVVDLPLDGPAPAPLPALNQDLAVYELYARVSTDVPEIWKDKHNRALKILGDIAAGVMVLQPDPGDSRGRARTMTVAARTKVFPAGELEEF